MMMSEFRTEIAGDDGDVLASQGPHILRFPGSARKIGGFVTNKVETGVEGVGDSIAGVVLTVLHGGETPTFDPRVLGTQPLPELVADPRAPEAPEVPGEQYDSRRLRVVGHGALAGEVVVPRGYEPGQQIAA